MSKSVFIRVDKEIEVGDFVRCIKADYLGVPGTVGKAEYVCHFNPREFIVVGCKTPMLRNKWEVVHELKVGDEVLHDRCGVATVTYIFPASDAVATSRTGSKTLPASSLRLYQPKKEPSTPGYNLVLNENMGTYDGKIRTMRTPSDDFAITLHAYTEDIIRLNKHIQEKCTPNTIDKIESWAKDKQLQLAEPKAQLCKLLEEAGELAEGIIKDRPEQVKDSIGDCVVVLTILAFQVGLTIEECVDYAYDQIKERTGKMVNGIFVKSEDLKED